MEGYIQGDADNGSNAYCLELSPTDCEQGQACLSTSRRQGTPYVSTGYIHTRTEDGRSHHWPQPLNQICGSKAEEDDDNYYHLPGQRYRISDMAFRCAVCSHPVHWFWIHD